jgi:hypothetical protein
MPGPCERCAHFRPEQQPSERLAHAWSKETAKTLERNRDAEHQLHTAENRLKLSQLEMRRPTWPRRPQVLAHCGLKEARGTYFIHEMKNRGQACQDFQPGHHGQPRTDPAQRQGQPPHVCETCIHRVEPRGLRRDAQLLRDVISPSLNAYNDGMAEGPGSSSRADRIIGNVDRVMEMAETRKALEMRMAMERDGTMPTVPEYYPYCARYSSENNYVLCRVKNPDGQCPEWSDGGWSGVPPSGESAWGW